MKTKLMLTALMILSILAFTIFNTEGSFLQTTSSYLSIDYSYLEQGETIVDVETKNQTTFFVTSKGELFVIGSNAHGQLGTGVTGNNNALTNITQNFNLDENEGILSFSVGDYFSAAITTNHRLFTWGYNEHGALGKGDVSVQLLPFDITENFNLSDGDYITKVVTGSWHMLVLTHFGEVFAFGLNSAGQIGNNTNVRSNLPVNVTSFFSTFEENEFIVDIDTEVNTSFAISNLGKIYGWGENTNGQINKEIKPILPNAILVPTDFTQAFELDAGDGIIKIAVGLHNRAVVTKHGHLFIWGHRVWGVTGDGSVPNSHHLKPVNLTKIDNALNLVNTNDKMVDVEFGYYHAIATTESGQMYVWGTNSYHRIGLVRPNTIYVPYNLTQSLNLLPNEKPLRVSAGHYGTIVLTTQNRVISWGSDFQGELLGGHLVRNIRPTLISTGRTLSLKTPFVHLNDSIKYTALGSNSTLIVTELNQVYTFGHSTLNESGDQSTTRSPLPRNITHRFGFQEGEVVNSVLGLEHTFFVTTSFGRVFSWGHNYWGQIGNGVSTTQPVPLDITENFGFNALTNERIKKMDGYREHVVVLTTDNRVFVWGYNNNGQLGDGTLTLKRTPLDLTENIDGTTNDKTALPEGEFVIDVATGFAHTMLLTNLGRVFTFGLNGNGQLGNNTLTRQTRPLDVTSFFTLDVSSNEKISEIQAGPYQSLAKTTNGRLFVWGLGVNYQLGTLKNTNERTPVDITKNIPLEENETVRFFTMGDFHLIVSTSKNRVLTVGNDGNGQLGDGAPAATHQNAFVDITHQFNFLKDESIASIEAMWVRSSLTTNEGKFYTYGINNHAQGGNNLFSAITSPYLVNPGGGKRHIVQHVEMQETYAYNETSIVIDIFFDSKITDEIIAVKINDVTHTQFTIQGGYVSVRVDISGLKDSSYTYHLQTITLKDDRVIELINSNADPYTVTTTLVDHAPKIVFDKEFDLVIEGNTNGLPYLGATAIDDIDGNIDVIVTGSVDFSVPGFYFLTYQATDSSNQTTTRVRQVVVLNELKTNITSNYHLTASLLDNYVTGDSSDIIIRNLQDQLSGVVNMTNQTVQFAFSGIQYSPVNDISSYAGGLGTRGYIYEFEVFGRYFVFEKNAFNPDKTAPTFDDIPTQTLEIFSEPINWTLFPTNVSDNSGGEVTIEVTSNNINYDVFGTYSVTLKFSDSVNNFVLKTFSVVIADTTKPILTLLGNQTVKILVGVPYVDLGVSYFDNFTPFSPTIVTGQVDHLTSGTYTIAYNASDAFDNEAITVTRTVIVLENTPQNINALIEDIVSDTQSYDVRIVRMGYDLLSLENQMLITHYDTFLLFEDASSVHDVIKNLNNQTPILDVALARLAYESLADEAKQLVTNVSNLTLIEKVSFVLENISSLSDTSHLEDVRFARAAYENLSDFEKTLIHNIDTLSDREFSVVVEGVIEDISQAKLNSTLDNIAIARASYDALTDAEKQHASLATAHSDLQAAENGVSESLIPVLEVIVGIYKLQTPYIQTDVSNVLALFNALDETTQQVLVVNKHILNEAQSYLAVVAFETYVSTLSAPVLSADVLTARAMYEALTSSEQTMVSNDSLNTLEQHESIVRVREVKARIEGFASPALDSEVREARAMYDALSEVEQAQLSDAFQTLQSREDDLDIERVETQINALSETSDRKALEDARFAYEALDASNKARVLEATLLNLETLESAQRVFDVIASIDALTHPVEATQVEAARLALEALSVSERSSVTNIASLHSFEAVVAFETYVSTLSEPVLSADVLTARAMYEALTSSEQTMVSNDSLNTLEQNESIVRVREVKARIEGFASPALDSEVREARAMYDALSEVEQAQLSDAFQTLQSREDDLDIERVETQINALSETSDRKALEDARFAYEALDASNKARVLEATLLNLETLESAQRVFDVIASIEALTHPVEATRVEAARLALEALSVSERSSVTNIASLHSFEAVVAFETYVSTLSAPVVSADVLTARAMYEALTSSEQTMVSNDSLNTLEVFETLLEVVLLSNKVSENETAENIQAFQDAYNALSDVEKSQLAAYMNVDDVNQLLSLGSPVVSLNGNAFVTIEIQTSYLDLGATFTDYKDGNGDVTAVGEVNTSVIGTYTLTYSHTDLDGNVSDTITRQVQVTDTIAPTFTPIPTQYIQQDASPINFLLLIEAFDNSLLPVSTNLVSNNVNYALPGTYEVVISLKDTSLNETMVTIDVFISATMYTINYVLNDGVNSENNPNVFTILSETIVLLGAEKVGHTFVGWFNQDANGTEVKTINSGSKDDVTLYARFSANNFSMTYDLDGGVNETNPMSYTIVSETFTLADAFKIGYTFVGWFDEASNGTEVKTIERGSIGDISLYARFTVNTYTLTFNSNGGTIVSPVTLNFESPITPPSDPIRVGYTFSGWDVLIPAFMPANDVIVEATWTVNTYILTFNSNGGTIVSPVTLNFESPITPPSDPTRVGYTFSGWDVLIPAFMPANDVIVEATWTVNTYTLTFNSNGGTIVSPVTLNFESPITPPSDPIRVGYTFSGWDVLIPAFMPANDVIVEATWTVNTYILTFNSNGGTIVSPVTLNFESPITPPSDPTRVGYTFSGWDVLIPAFMPANDVIVEATWTINTYVITYVLELGINGNNPNTYTIESQTIDLVDASKIGHTFIGWFDQTSNGTEVNTIESRSIGNVTVYARFEINSYVLSFNTLGGSSIDAIELTYNSDLPSFETPLREGFIFMGWVLNYASKMPAQDVVITASWMQKQVVASEVQATATGVEAAVIATIGAQEGDVTVNLNVSVEQQADANQDDVTTINEKISETQTTQTALVLLNINLEVSIDNVSQLLSVLSQHVSITVVIPKEFLGNQGYTIVRVHDGVADLLDTVHNGDEDTLTFETDRFSTYAIIVNLNEDTMTPLFIIVPSVVVAIALIFGLAVANNVKKSKKIKKA